MNQTQEQDKNLTLFRELYKHNASMLIFYACKFVELSVAEDIVQDIFVKIWQKKIYLFIKDNPKSYLFRSVRYGCLDFLKHQELQGDYIQTTINRLRVEEIYFNDDPSFLFTEDERIDLIMKKIKELPDKCREIFIMSYLEERKSSEIALLMNISQRTVEAQLYKALKILRTSFSPIFFFFIFYFWA